MNKFNLLILVVVFGLSSCQNDGNTSASANNDSVGNMKIITDSNILTSTIDSLHTAKNSLDWEGTYVGTIPAENGEVSYEIMLHNDNTYMLSSTTSSKQNFNGKFNWIDGSTIELENYSAGINKFFVAENKLIQLDKDGKLIKGEHAQKFELKKTNTSH